MRRECPFIGCDTVGVTHWTEPILSLDHLYL